LETLNDSLIWSENDPRLRNIIDNINSNNGNDTASQIDDSSSSENMVSLSQLLNEDNNVLDVNQNDTDSDEDYGSLALLLKSEYGIHTSDDDVSDSGFSILNVPEIIVTVYE